MRQTGKIRVLTGCLMQLTIFRWDNSTTVLLKKIPLEICMKYEIFTDEMMY